MNRRDMTSAIALTLLFARNASAMEPLLVLGLLKAVTDFVFNGWQRDVDLKRIEAAIEIARLQASRQIGGYGGGGYGGGGYGGDPNMLLEQNRPFNYQAPLPGTQNQSLRIHEGDPSIVQGNNFDPAINIVNRDELPRYAGFWKKEGLLITPQSTYLAPTKEINNRIFQIHSPEVWSTSYLRKVRAGKESMMEYAVMNQRTRERKVDFI